VPASSRLSWKAVALSTALALGAAVGTYQLLTKDDDAPKAPEDSLALTPDGPSDPDRATFTTFDGESVALPSIYGTPTVVNFFASTCVPCVTEMPAFETVHQALGDDVAFLGLAVTDRPEDALALVDETGVTYPTAQDKDGSVINALGGIGLPTTVLLAADGSIVAQHTGQLTADELSALIADNLDLPG
jgi:cytochrome c biogenesis protein CcmG, thiol:disulfide interchange protein DsbE